MAQDRAVRTTALVVFFDLPRNIRDEIYGLVLIAPYPLLLFQDSPGHRVESFAPGKPAQWAGLLLASRQLHAEGSETFYGKNCFNVVDTTMEREVAILRSYLSCIGSTNASLLSHLCISFPVPIDTKGQPAIVRLGEDGLRSLQHLQELCANLKTLETYVHRGNSQYLVEVSPTDTLLVPEMLLEVDRQLKAIPSLSNIIIRFYNGRPTSLVKETMQGLGWTVFMTNEDHY
jgi:hypothetical protein